MSEIIERIEREAGVPGLAAILAERLSAADLQSLLLDVYRQRSARRQPADVLTAFENDRFVRPSAVSPRRLLAWEQAALESLPPEFEPIELSPVSPLGTSSAVSATPQDWVISTARGSEVVSDSTNVLALECALRRRALLRSDPKSTAAVHLAASHRLVRAQFYGDPKALAHFGAFALCSAGRDQGNLRFEFDALTLHIRFYITALRAFIGPDAAIQVAVTDFSPAAQPDAIETRLLAPLRSEFASVEFTIDQARSKSRGYYVPLCFHIYVTDSSGAPLELVDGGCVGWTQQLLSSAKERLVISGIGSERLCAEF